MSPRETNQPADQDRSPNGAGPTSVGDLYRARQDSVDFLDVPRMGFAMVDGRGAPGGADFTCAVQALFAVSFGAHFGLSRSGGRTASKVMPLEALWWIEGPDAARLMERLAMGGAGPEPADQERWHWRAMMMQLPPIDGEAVMAAVGAAKARQDTPALDAVRFEEWEEGPSAQIMHVGPYGEEQRDIAVLHKALAEHGYHPRGRHHEIYLSDPRRTAPERLRTILRHPYAVAD